MPESYYQLGNTFSSEARYDSAQVYLLKAVALKAGQPDMLNRLGQMQDELALYEEALRTTIMPLKLNPAAAQRDSAGIAIRLNNIGGVLHSKGKYAASAKYEQALRIDRQVFGESHPIVAIRLNNIWWGPLFTRQICRSHR